MQALRGASLPSEKVYVSGLTFLWPEITRIPNIPQDQRLERMDQRADDRHRDTLAAIQALKR